MPGAKDQNQPGAGEKDENENDDQNQNPGGGDSGGSNDDELSPEDMKKVIKNLRKENAKYRTQKQSQEDSFKSLSEQLGAIKKHLKIEDNVDPAEQIKSLTTSNESLEFELSMVNLARENEIPKDLDGYFRFEMQQALMKLKDDEEMSDEAIQEIVEKVKKLSSAQGGGSNSSGVGGKKPPQKPPEGGEKKPTVDEFKKMSLAQKNELYQKDRETYDKLSALSRR